MSPRKATSLSKRSTTVPDSDQDTSDQDQIPIATTRNRSKSQVQVVIPVMSSRSKAALRSNSPSSLSSANSRDVQSIDTPATSAGVTPEPSVRGHPGNKRKRDTDDDAAIAQKLQEEEWAEVAQPSKKIKAEPVDTKKSRRSYEAVVIEDTDGDDMSDLSSAMSFKPEGDSEDESTFKKPKGKAARQTVVETDEDEPLKYKSRLSKARAGKKPVVPQQRNSVVIPDSDSELSTFSELDEVEMPTEDEFRSQDAQSGAADSTDEEDDQPLALTNIRRRRGQANLQGRDLGAEIKLRRGMSRKDRERLKLEKAHPLIKTMWKDLEAIPIIKGVAGVQPPSINRKLKSYQLEGVDWMIRQEQSNYKGGLLGDEMGMGKTIQAVSLIMSDYPQKQPTLVLVPPVALMQWSQEIGEYTDGKLKVLVYHGTNAKSKNMKVGELKKYDVIMISYNSLESLHRKEVKGWSRNGDIVKEASPIHALTYHRLILDEAHSIKTRTTQVAKACFALKGKYKWCLSGTPVQNRIGEFFSLLRFLEVRPFADYFCKKCPCSLLHWSLDAQHMCTECKHTGMEHVSVFNQELLNPITQSEDSQLRSEAMDKLFLITSRIMLRRMKRDYVSSMELPPKEVIVHNEFFGDIERDFSQSIMSNTARQFDTYVSRGVMLNNYANIFGLIMQMRQVSNHPDLILKRKAAEGMNVLVCNICDEPAEEPIRSKCKHDFCRTCVKNYAQSVEEDTDDVDCPRCHIPLSIDFDMPELEQNEEAVKKNSIINRIKMENWTSSTKIEMLVYDLYKLRSKKQTLKSIVFSQFTSMLQLIEWRLRRAGFNTVMLDGSMTPQQRQKSIEHFMTDPDVEVFLVSLKAGGVALNLTEASRVFIVDPWWNPAAEWQSADRCHRIGQRRPCVITRLCIEDSVESRIVMLQEKKANMINGTINNDRVAMEKLTPEDMQFLFRGN
jgi:DNA repair protein RAD16